MKKFYLLFAFVLLAVFVAGCASKTATPTGNPNLENGRDALVNKNFDLAIKELDKAIQAEPANAEAFYLRGTAYYGRYEEAYRTKDPGADGEDFWRAITDFTKAIELNHGYPEAYHYRALTYNGLGMNEHALADYDYAIYLKADMEFPYYGRAVVYEQTGRIQDAIADYRQFMALSKDDYWRGEAQKRLDALLGVTPLPTSTPAP